MSLPSGVFPLAGYFHHIEVGESNLVGKSDAEKAQVIAAAQHARIPFENLDVFLGRPLTADPGDIVGRILGEGRGGFCYQLNGLLLLALNELGIDARPVAARVRTDAGLGRERGHMALALPLGGGRSRLLDVGFGGDAVVTDIDPADPGSLAITTPTGRYLLDPRPVELADFEEPAHWQSTSPRSRFTGSVICSRTRDGVRRTLTARPDEAGALRYRLVETRDGDTAPRTEREVAHDEVAGVLAAAFDVRLPGPPLRVPAELRAHR